MFSANPGTKMKWTLYYDGACNLCHKSKKILEGWAKNANQPLEAISLEDRKTIKGESPHIILEAEKTYRGADAWFKIATLGPWYIRWITIFEKFTLIKRLFYLLYSFIAKNRHRWFGRK